MRLVLMLLLVCSAACRPKAGDACKAGSDRCTDSASALACVDGRFVAVACRGPEGCAVKEGTPRCDDAIAADGDGCATPGDMACSADKAAILRCDNEAHFRVAGACRGPGGCVGSANGVTCDVGLAQAGEACTREDNHACSVDHTAMLVCTGGAFRVALRCRGADGCAARADRIECDDSIANVGDACDFEGDVACSGDGASILTCKEHTFAASRTCKTRCEVRGRGALCD